MPLPIILRQFLDTTCLLCSNETDALAEPVTLVTYPDNEMVHGLVCQNCIAAHEHGDMHVSTLAASVNAFEQWQASKELTCV